MAKFISHLFELYDILDALMRLDLPMTFTAEDKLNFDAATYCWLCEQPFESREYITHLSAPLVRDLIKCRHHSHLDSKYVGTVHSLCNLQLKYKNRAIPILTHNFAKYDSHFIVQGIDREIDVQVVPSNSEHYISVIFDNKLKFLDSFQFLPSSLSALIEEIPPDNFKIIPQIFEQDVIPFVSGKGVFPYDYVSSFENFLEDKLPPQADFYNTLNEEELSDEDYEFAGKMWDAFEINNLGEYSDLYLLTDIAILAEIFENFRELCITNHRLDPVHYYTLPGFTWDAFLRMNKTPIELLTDEEKYEFLEGAIRGGIAQVSKRFAEANNPMIPDTYKPEKPTSYLMYLDFVNLYGWGGLMKMPHKNFKWLDEVELAAFSKDLATIDPKGDKWYAVEVDHSINTHNDLPLAVDRRCITYDMLSDFQKKLLSNFPEIKLSKIEKLVPSILPKRNYICLLENLKFHLQHGLILKKIHRVLKADQAAILQEYIQFNSIRRGFALTKFEISFWKALNNQLYGKTIQNVRGQLDVRIATTSAQFKKLSSNSAVYDIRLVHVGSKYDI